MFVMYTWHWFNFFPNGLRRTLVMVYSKHSIPGAMIHMDWIISHCSCRNIQIWTFVGGSQVVFAIQLKHMPPFSEFHVFTRFFFGFGMSFLKHQPHTIHRTGIFIWLLYLVAFDNKIWWMYVYGKYTSHKSHGSVKREQLWRYFSPFQPKKCWSKASKCKSKIFPYSWSSTRMTMG